MAAHTRFLTVPSHRRREEQCRLLRPAVCAVAGAGPPVPPRFASDVPSACAGAAANGTFFRNALDSCERLMRTPSRASISARRRGLVQLRRSATGSSSKGVTTRKAASLFTGDGPGAMLDNYKTELDTKVGDRLVSGLTKSDLDGWLVSMVVEFDGSERVRRPKTHWKAPPCHGAHMKWTLRIATAEVAFRRTPAFSGALGNGRSQHEAAVAGSNRKRRKSEGKRS